MPDVCLSVCLLRTSGLSREQRSLVSGTEVAHVTRGSDIIFKIKRSKVKVTGAGAYCGGLPHSLFHSFLETCVINLCNAIIDIGQGVRGEAP